jgi:hypothetical protein
LQSQVVCRDMQFKLKDPSSLIQGDLNIDPQLGENFISQVRHFFGCIKHKETEAAILNLKESN